MWSHKFIYTNKLADRFVAFFKIIFTKILLSFTPRLTKQGKQERVNKVTNKKINTQDFEEPGSPICENTNFIFDSTCLYFRSGDKRPLFPRLVPLTITANIFLF